MSKRFKALNMTRKQGNWVLYGLEPEDIERDLSSWEQWSQTQNQKEFLHLTVTGNGNWVHYHSPKHKISWDITLMHPCQQLRMVIYFFQIRLCILEDQLVIVYFELLKMNQSMTNKFNQSQFTCLSQPSNTNCCSTTRD